MAYSTYIQNFVDRVLAYAGRDASIFTTKTNAVDLCFVAINEARKKAQQDYDWEQQKTSGAIKVNASSGAPWAYTDGTYGPYTDDTGATPLRLKSIESVWNYAKDTFGNMQPTNAILLDNQRWFRKLLPTNMGYPFTQIFPQNPPFYYNTIPTQQMFAYIVGPKFYVNTCNVSPSWFMIFGSNFLPDLAGSETSDFFIDNYSKWLLLSTIQNLNLFTKEDQRVQILNAEATREWATATFDDTKKGYQGDSWTNLD